MAALKIGDQVAVHKLEHLLAPVLGRIIAITTKPGKTVGVEFEEPIGLHSCDGRGKDKYCIWAALHHLVMPDQIAAVQAELQRQIVPPSLAVDNAEIDIGDDGKLSLRKIDQT